jgi:hypothetical protein
MARVRLATGHSHAVRVNRAGQSPTSGLRLKVDVEIFCAGDGFAADEIAAIFELPVDVVRRT